MNSIKTIKPAVEIIRKYKNPFALLKLEDKSFNFDKDLKCGDAKIKVLRPDWI